MALVGGHQPRRRAARPAQPQLRLVARADFLVLRCRLGGGGRLCVRDTSSGLPGNGGSVAGRVRRGPVRLFSAAESALRRRRSEFSTARGRFFVRGIS